MTTTWCGQHQSVHLGSGAINWRHAELLPAKRYAMASGYKPLWPVEHKLPVKPPSLPHNQDCRASIPARFFKAGIRNTVVATAGRGEMELGWFQVLRRWCGASGQPASIIWHRVVAASAQYEIELPIVIEICPRVLESASPTRMQVIGVHILQLARGAIFLPYQQLATITQVVIIHPIVPATA
eukprot:COSAG05_NODE_4489_length_1492_cov_1.205312_1_plen_183_part_00